MSAAVSAAVRYTPRPIEGIEWPEESLTSELEVGIVETCYEVNFSQEEEVVVKREGWRGDGGSKIAVELNIWKYLG